MRFEREWPPSPSPSSLLPAGVVTGLLGVPVSQVAMGRSHTCVLTQHGIIYTFGNNTYGQCGRNFVPIKEQGEGGRGDGGMVGEREGEGER